MITAIRADDARVDQRCDACSQFDKHPRHSHVAGDGSVVIRHMDCCHNAGCPTGSCSNFMQESGHAHGDDLVRFLEDWHAARGDA